MRAELTIGTMNFGGRTSPAEARKIVDRAIERGLTHFDTANLYSEGASEQILGEAIAGRRDRVQLATKVGLFRRQRKGEGLSKGTIARGIDESLGRLRTDYVDLYYLHAPDPATPFEETLDALQPLLESGKIRAWGVSNFASWQILELQRLADARGMPRPQVSQVLYNLLVRQLDVEYFAFAGRHRIRTTVFNPLAGGVLARAPERGAAIPKDSRFGQNPLYAKRYWSDPLFELTSRLAALAQELSMPLVSLAYAWLAERPGVDAILSGPRTLEHLDAAIEGVAQSLPPEARRKIDELHRAYLGTDATYARCGGYPVATAGEPPKA